MMKLTVDAFRAKMGNITMGDAEILAQHSVINHHANGLNYICLQRTPEETIKIYYMPEPKNENWGMLVHPHNHRYFFKSIVLHGELYHYRFKEGGIDKCNCLKHLYDWKTKKLCKGAHRQLDRIKVEHHDKGSCYYVETHEIHSLEILQPTIIGLIQYEDTDELAWLYKPSAHSFTLADSRSPSGSEYLGLLHDIVRILDGKKPIAKT